MKEEVKAQYPESLKRRVVQVVQSGKLNSVEAAKRFGVGTAQSVRNWVAQYGDKAVVRSTPGLPALNGLSKDVIVRRLGEYRLKENAAIADMVLYIAEADRRKLYVGEGYDSMFSYLTKELGYSTTGANNRLSAARAFQKHPEIYHKLKTGALTVSSLADSARRIIELPKTESKRVLKSIEGKSRKENMIAIRQGEDLNSRPFSISEFWLSPKVGKNVQRIKAFLRLKPFGLAADTLEYIESMELRIQRMEAEIRGNKRAA